MELHAWCPQEDDLLKNSQKILSLILLLEGRLLEFPGIQRTKVRFFKTSDIVHCNGCVVLLMQNVLN
jgi:hypothetical protein